MKDFNDFSKLNQPHLLIYETIISKKSFADLFSVNSLCNLKERMSPIILNHNFVCSKCAVTLNRAKKSVTCSKCFSVFHFSCVNLTAKPKKPWFCTAC